MEVKIGLSFQSLTSIVVTDCIMVNKYDSPEAAW